MIKSKGKIGGDCSKTMCDPFYIMEIQLVSTKALFYYSISLLGEYGYFVDAPMASTILEKASIFFLY